MVSCSLCCLSFEQSIAEATKIAKIREELEKLDQELAADVEILRREIEAVTQQYTATKWVPHTFDGKLFVAFFMYLFSVHSFRETYNQIESQFLAAKLSLHQITEKKEMLTEHLCTIISHNEDRKAKKLTELLDKVGLDQATDSSQNTPQNSLQNKKWTNGPEIYVAINEDASKTNFSLIDPIRLSPCDVEGEALTRVLFLLLIKIKGYYGKIGKAITKNNIRLAFTVVNCNFYGPFYLIRFFF